MSPILIPPDGPLTARIALIGQNPGKTEINEYVLKPFQGYSGNLLKKWWSLLDPPMRREEIYVDNLIPYLCDPEKLDAKELSYWEEELHKRLAKLTQVNVIVPVGNHASYALIRKGKVAGASKKDSVGITSLRGSIYEYVNTYSGRSCKVIPTLHPSALFQRNNSGKMGVTKGILEKRVFRDWQRIQQESYFLEIREPNRTYIINPYEADVAEYTNRVEEQGEEIALAVDIETPFGKIDCIGFSHDPSTALVIPTFTQKERDTFYPYINRLLASNSMKVFQNGHFDTYWLRNYGFTISNWLWDLLYMHVVIHPADNHSLDFLSSVYLPFHKYWKDHAKEDNGEGAYVWTESREDLLTYNGMDACISRELLDYIYADMNEHNLVDYYFNNVQPLLAPALDIALTGVNVDLDAQVKLREESVVKIADIRAQLKQLAGEDLIAKSGLSPLKLRRFVHETLKLPKKYKLTKKIDGKSKSVSLDATVLAQLAYSYKSFKEPAQLIVDFRSEQKKLESWLDPNKQDDDGYVRAQFSPTTEAGRFASKRHPMGRGVKIKKVKGAPRKKKGDWIHYSSDEILEQGLTELKKRKCKCKPKMDNGWDVYIPADNPPEPKVINKGYNLQNTKKEIRRIYVPDSGCLFLEIDASQIEDRECKMYTGAPRMVELANRHPSEFDVHTHNAVLVFGVPPGQVSKGQRFLGKIVSHGAERGMTGKKLSDKLLADHDILMAPTECQGMIDKFLEENWEIRDIFFPWVRSEIITKGYLVNSWGRRWNCKDETLDEDLYRRGYSFPMQSECADLINCWGLIPVHNYLVNNYYRLRSRINIPRHDALIMSVPFDNLYEVSLFTLACIERPRVIFGNTLTVPCSIKVGLNDAYDEKLGEGIEFKRLPKKDDFMDQVKTALSL